MNLQSLQKVCLAISDIKQQLVEELPHYGNQSLYFQNDEITTGLINNKTEIKIHLANMLILYKNRLSLNYDIRNLILTTK